MAADPLLIHKAWLSFKDQVIPPEATEEQIVEMRRAFFAGSYIVTTAIVAAVDEHPDDHDAAAEVVEFMTIEADRAIRLQIERDRVAGIAKRLGIEKLQAAAGRVVH